ncbi:MAG: polyamine aminopropyltransferase, partial [Clostridia bacterium]|nr:polyamine aminopropyltransferase [Clostridia bacterium]
MELWASEMQTNDMQISLRISEILYTGVSEFQRISVVNSEECGRMLFLDDIIQTTIKDEFVYHEMITHVGLNTLPKPKKVLVVGGGDGGAIREIVKHSSVEKAVLVEIDRMVIEAARKYLPEISCALDHPKVEVIVDDGIKHVREHKNTYDMIIVDSTDPIGAAEGLFGAEFYQDVYEALTEDGLFVAQTESPFFEAELIKRVQKDIARIFPLTRLYLGNVPTYPGGLWTFSLGSKKYDPKQITDITNIFCFL